MTKWILGGGKVDEGWGITRETGLASGGLASGRGRGNGLDTGLSRGNARGERGYRGQETDHALATGL